jgi:hypothetical protein
VQSLLSASSHGKIGKKYVPCATSLADDGKKAYREDEGRPAWGGHYYLHIPDAARLDDIMP